MADFTPTNSNPRPYNSKKIPVQEGIAITGGTYVNAGMLASTPVIISGHGVPTDTAPAGSLYLRKSGAAGARLYVSSGGGTWAAVAGV